MTYRVGVRNPGLFSDRLHRGVSHETARKLEAIESQIQNLRAGLANDTRLLSNLQRNRDTDPRTIDRYVESMDRRTAQLERLEQDAQALRRGG